MTHSQTLLRAAVTGLATRLHPGGSFVQAGQAVAELCISANKVTSRKVHTVQVVEACLRQDMPCQQQQQPGT